jgi:hypothetical protein
VLPYADVLISIVANRLRAQIDRRMAVQPAVPGGSHPTAAMAVVTVAEPVIASYDANHITRVRFQQHAQCDLACIPLLEDLAF